MTHNLTLQSHSTYDIILQSQLKTSSSIHSVPQHRPHSVVWHSWGSHCVSVWRMRYCPMVDNIGVAVDEVEFRQVFSHHLGFPLPMFHIHPSMKGWHSDPCVAVQLQYQGTQSHPTPMTTLIPYEPACTHILWIFHHGASSEGAAVAQWLRCCVTDRKVAGLIPDGVIGIFHWHNPSDRTMVLGLTQPLTEMSTRRISWG